MKSREQIYRRITSLLSLGRLTSEEFKELQSLGETIPTGDSRLPSDTSGFPETTQQQPKSSGLSESATLDSSELTGKDLEFIEQKLLSRAHGPDDETNWNEAVREIKKDA